MAADRRARPGMAADRRPGESPLSRYAPELMRFVDRMLTRSLRDFGAQNGHVPTIDGLDEFLADLGFAGETNVAKLPARAVPSWIATAEAARLAGCSAQWMRRQANGEGPVIGRKVGKQWIYERSPSRLTPARGDGSVNVAVATADKPPAVKGRHDSQPASPVQAAALELRQAGQNLRRPTACWT